MDVKGMQIPLIDDDWFVGQSFSHFIGQFLISLLARLRGLQLIRPYPQEHPQDMV